MPLVGWAEGERRNTLQNNLHVKVPYDDESNVTDWTASCILELSKMTVCTRVDGMGPGDAFAVPELLTGLATADTDDLVSGLVSSSGCSRGLDTELSTKLKQDGLTAFKRPISRMFS